MLGTTAVRGSPGRDLTKGVTVTKVDQQITDARALSTLAEAGLTTQYQSMLASAAIAEGHELVDQLALVDVPFIVTGVTYRDGIPTPDKRPTNYLSIEILIGDAEALRRRKERGKLPQTWDAFDPHERLVFNDGSTGIARQITAYLESQGVIVLPDGPDGGDAGESRFDTYRGEWPGIDIGVREDGTLEPLYVKFGPGEAAPFLSLPRGLRRSDYASAKLGGAEATTFYAG